MVSVAVNGLFCCQKTTGVQRYALEITQLLKKKGLKIDIHSPSGLSGSSALCAHLWEQAYLPLKLKPGQLLWSPTNTGPAWYRNQVVTVHDGAVFAHPEWFSRQYVAWRRLVLPKLIRHARHLITVSEFAKENICNNTGLPEEKITVIPNGINHAFFRPACFAEVEPVLGKYHLVGNYLLTVGSFDPRKNFRRLLEAWSRIEEKYPDITMVVVGGDSANFADHGTIQQAQKVCLLGYCPDQDLPALYSGAMAFLYPSIFEGFGLPPLEAMACGTAVVTSGISSLPEVVGDAALLVDPYDVESIINGIEKIITDDELRERFCSKGLQRASQFTWERTADRTWQVLQEYKG